MGKVYTHSQTKMVQKPYPLGRTYLYALYLTVIPRARMGTESIAREAKGQKGYWLRGHVGERNNCFSKIQLVGQKYQDKTT